MMDFVRCSRCGFIGTVEMGAEACACCNEEGVLAWVDDNKQEVENDVERVVLFELDNGYIDAFGITREDDINIRNEKINLKKFLMLDEEEAKIEFLAISYNTEGWTYDDHVEDAIDYLVQTSGSKRATPNLVY